jgi:putative membrane protein
MIIVDLIRGMFMAFADSVPGVSGGTIAFVMGFYNELIDSINVLVSHSSVKHKKNALIFLSKIGVGWTIGLISSVLFIASIFESEIYNISSLFIGFILFSIPIVLKEEYKNLKNNYKHLTYLLVGIIIVSLLTYFNPVSKGGGIDISISHLSLGLVFYVFMAGAIAISAMILPGISGSTLLLIFGLYTPIITATRHVILFNFSYLPILVVFALGILFGIVTIVKLISTLLKTKRSQLVYFILGLMIGSFYAVFMGPTTLEVPLPPMDISNFNLFFFFIGALIIVLLDSLKFISKPKASYK